MARSNVFADHNATSESLESVLRVGQLRLRPYKNGNVKHAHVVLRKVDEEGYEDACGRKCTRGVFSLFAQKVISVKPGKEIFFSVDGYLRERVVAFEADLQNATEIDADIVDSTKSEETVVQRETQALPPKLRKMWARKESVVVKQDVRVPATCAKRSVGVQAVPLAASVDVQTTPALVSVAMQTQSSSSSVTDESRPTSSSVEIQVEAPSIDPYNQPPSSLVAFHASTRSSNSKHIISGSTTSVGLDIIEHPAISSSLTSSGTEDVGAKSTHLAKADSRCSSRQRSLSPMDLDSAPSSPEYSPELLVVDLPLDEDDANAHSLVELRETAEESQLASAVTLVESPPFHVKEEPEEIVLTPLSPVRHESSYAYRAPTFVPARHDLSQQTIDIHDQDTLSTPTSSKITLDLHAKLPSKPPSPRNPVQISGPRTALTSPAAYVPTTLNTVRTAHAAFVAPSAHAVPSVPAVSRAGPRLAPTFVPATQISQSSLPHLPRIQPSPLPLSPPKSEVMPQFAPAPSPWPSVSRNTSSKKRKRARVAAAAASGTKRDTVESPSKKWKPIVKPEPQSPTLSSVPTAVPILGDFETSGRLRPPRLVRAASPPPGLSKLVALRQGQIDMAAPTVKCEPIDPVSLSFDAQLFRPPLPIPSLYLPPPRSPIDLTRPQRYQRTTPWKPQSARRYSGGACSELPVIRTAQIKSDTVGWEAGVRAIVFDSTGERFAVICRDRTVRVWDNVSCSEIAKLAHNASVVSVAWLEGGKSVASMGSNGIVSKWSLVGKNRWMWEKLVDSGDADPSCLACYRHLLAIANPRKGVKIWECKNGSWLPLERDVPRKDVLSIKFVNDGSDLLCGSSDGTVFRCTIPRCRVEPVTTFKTKVFHVDAGPKNTLALAAQAGGCAHLVELAPSMNKRDIGRVLQDYSLRTAEQQYGGRGTHNFGPLFTDYGDAVIFGSIDGRVLVWDRRRGQIIHEMDHGGDVLVQAVASFDGEDGEHHLISSTRCGLLTWWRLPIRIF